MKNTPHISSAFRDMATGAGMITLGLAAAFLASVAGMANHSEGIFSLKQHNPALGTRIEAEDRGRTDGASAAISDGASRFARGPSLFLKSL